MTEKILQILDLTPLDVRMILIGTVIFFVFMKLLERTLFAPHMRLSDAREASTSGAAEAAQKMNREAEKIQAKYEEQIGIARKNAMNEKAALVGKARAEADRIVQAAEGEAEESIRQAKLEGAEYIENNRPSIQGQANDLSALIVSRILQ